jgi:predicted transposase YdaD
VIYLTKDSAARGPYSWVYPKDFLIHWFHFDVLKLWEIPTEELLETKRLGVLPLLPLTREGQQREVVEEGIQLLAPSGEEPRRELLSLLYSFASLTFESRDHEWLHGRFSMLYDILSETPAFQEIAKWAKNEGITEGRAEGEKSGALKNLRQVATDLIATRFASAILNALARGTLADMDDVSQLQRLILALAGVQTPEEARLVLTGSW